jgi:hypothetical protein
MNAARALLRTEHGERGRVERTAAAAMPATPARAAQPRAAAQDGSGRFKQKYAARSGADDAYRANFGRARIPPCPARPRAPYSTGDPLRNNRVNRVNRGGGGGRR